MKMKHLRKLLNKSEVGSIDFLLRILDIDRPSRKNFNKNYFFLVECLHL